MTAWPPIRTATLALLFYLACWPLSEMWRYGPPQDWSAAKALYSAGAGMSALLCLAVLRWLAGWRETRTLGWVALAVPAAIAASAAYPQVEWIRVLLLLSLTGAAASVAWCAWRHGDGRAAAVWWVVAGGESVELIRRYGCKFAGIETFAPWAGDPVCAAVLGQHTAALLTAAVGASALSMIAWMALQRR